MQDNDKLVTPVFKSLAVLDQAKSKKEGRPIYKDVDMVEIRIAGDRNFKPCMPAHSFWKNIDGIAHTYAMRWPEQYRKFKEGSVQTAEGTPLEELPFLTQAKRYELKALSVYTAEALASLDGKNLKALGIGGRELKEQATAYLDNARGSADVSRLAQENASMKALIEEMRADMQALKGAAKSSVEIDDEDEPSNPALGEFDGWTDEQLKGYIADATGQRPRGNPNTETLKRMALDAQKVAA